MNFLFADKTTWCLHETLIFSILKAARHSVVLLLFIVRSCVLFTFSVFYLFFHQKRLLFCTRIPFALFHFCDIILTGMFKFLWAILVYPAEVRGGAQKWLCASAVLERSCKTNERNLYFRN